jgi:N,N'-diacetyllegionaminate synthase
MTCHAPFPFAGGGRRIGAGEPVFIICEAGVTNYGDRDLALRQIDAAVEAGADAVKFQLWRTENLVSRRVARRLEPDLGYNWFDRLKAKELSHDAIRVLQAHARANGILFLATPHDPESLAFLVEQLDVPFVKVGSGEAHNTSFLRLVGACRKPVLISFGFQSDDEASRAIETLHAAGAPAAAALHCVTQYPTPPQLADLGRIRELAALLDISVGYSDHSVGWHLPLAAVAMGACVLEKHVTFDKSDPRSLDNPGALLPDEFSTFVRQVRELESALATPPLDVQSAFRQQARDWAGQAIVAAREIAAGTVLDRSMLALKRPARHGLGPDAVDDIVGRRTRRAVAHDEQITMADVE